MELYKNKKQLQRFQCTPVLPIVKNTPPGILAEPSHDQPNLLECFFGVVLILAAFDFVFDFCLYSSLVVQPLYHNYKFYSASTTAVSLQFVTHM